MNANQALAVVVGVSVIHYSVMGYFGSEPSVGAETLIGSSLTLMFAWWACEMQRSKNITAHMNSVHSFSLLGQSCYRHI